jgi:hypothetical protein
MQVIKCFSIEVWDGGSMHNHKFYVASEEEAKKWKAKNTYDTYYAKTFVFDTLEEATENDTKKVKARALAKLTEIERQALGFPA